MSEYNVSTILNHEEVVFTPEEKVGVEKFHSSRIAFAFIDGVPAINVRDVREHRVYLREDFNIDDDTFETLIRGYVKPGRIVFYITCSYLVVPNLPQDLIDKAKLLAWQYFGEGEYSIENGVQVSELGTEWPPIQRIGTAKLFNSVEYYETIWASPMLQPSQVCMVRARELHGSEQFVYVGITTGLDEEDDIKSVLRTGAKWPISILRNFTK